MDLPTLLRSLGGVAHRSVLLSSGATAWQIEQALAAGAIFRVRRAWYGVPDAPAPVIRAVRVGGSLTSVSAAKSVGLWCIDDGRLHVSVPRNAGRLRSADDRRVALRNSSSGVCVHWRRLPGATTRLTEPIVSVLIHAIECQPEENAIAIIDSALEKGVVTRSALEQVFRDLDARFRRALDRSDGRAQSGTESLVRVRLRALGIRLRIQVNCGGPIVDILVGDRLVIECHSRAHHTGVENYARDRARELALVAAGYLTMTLSYEQVVTEWPAVERVILDIVRRGAHLWPRSRAR